MQESVKLTKTFVHKDTLNCALHRHCVPCLYKIKSHILDWSNIFIPQNKRPETCPRHQHNDSCHSIYNSNSKLLTLGDGDFSFSLSLLKANHEKSCLIATSYESYETITTAYLNCKSILDSLKSYNIQVYHNIDATQLHNYECIPSHHFDILIWNFPCVGRVDGADGQISEIEQNIMMLTSFFKNSIPYFRSSGLSEIHITHKTIEPFSWWNIIDIGISCGYEYIGAIVFDRCLYPGYINRKALDKKSFPSYDALIYVFQYSSGKYSSADTSSLSKNRTIIRSNTITFNESILIPLSEAEESLKEYLINSSYPHTHTLSMTGNGTSNNMNKQKKRKQNIIKEKDGDKKMNSDEEMIRYSKLKKRNKS